MWLNFIFVFICHLKKKIALICRIKKIYVFMCRIKKFMCLYVVYKKNCVYMSFNIKRHIYTSVISWWVHFSIYMLCCGFWWSGLIAFFFQHVFSFWKSRRCDDNQQITVSHFGKHKRLCLESSKQNYYIISLRVIIKAIFTSLKKKHT